MKPDALLLKAAKRGDVAEIRTLLANGGSVLATEAGTGRSALSFAAAAGALEAVKVLLEHGAEVDGKDKDKRTALSFAVSGDMATELIQRGASVDAKDARGFTPLLRAANSGHVDVLEVLLQHGADLHAKATHAGSALQNAARNGQAAVVTKLVELGVVPTIDHVLTAAQGGHSGVVFMMIDGGVDMNAKDWVGGRSALHQASLYGHLELVRALIRRGAEVNASDAWLKSPLANAASDRKVEVVKELIQSGALVDAKDEAGRTPLSVAATAHPVPHDVLATLIKYGADVDSYANDGKTPLAFAAEDALPECVEAMLRLAAFEPSDCPSDRLALFVAAVMGDHKSIEKLLASADGVLSVDEKTKYGRTPLFYAAQCGQADTVKLLLERGAVVDAKASIVPASKSKPSSAMSSLTDATQPNREYDTALTLAGRAGHLQICQALIAAGAPVNVRGAGGETLLTSAARWSFFSVVQLAVASGGAVRFEQVRENEYPLIPGTLTTMQRLCSEISFEFDSVCSRLLKRLMGVCSRVQAFDESRFRTFESNSLVSFATIVLRFCSIVFQIEERPNLLSRFIGSRAFLNKIEDMHAELDHFIGLLGLKSGDGDDSVGGGDWKAEMEAGRLLLLARFEAALSPTDALMSGYALPSRQTDAMLHLQYELRLWTAEGSTAAQELVARTLERFATACKKELPVLPEWFISRDDVEFSSWNLVKIVNGLSYHKGKWRKTDVVVEAGTFDLKKLQRDVPQWFKASHPNVIKLFGASYSGLTKLLVYELLPEAKPLHEFLRDVRDKQAVTTTITTTTMMWKCLYQAALGLQYLHSHEIVHGDLASENILVDPVLTTKLCGLRQQPHPYGSDTRDGKVWMAPEVLEMHSQFVKKIVPKSFAGDIYALGMCIWEAVAQEVAWSGVTGTKVQEQKEQGMLPSRPDAIGDDEWDLITKMCVTNPDERVKIGYVVNRLKQFLFDCDHAGNDGSGLVKATGADVVSIGDNPESSGAEIYRQSLDEHVFAELEGTTIPKALSSIRVRSEKLSTEPWLATNVVPALEFILTAIREQRKRASDLEVVQFCTAMTRLQRYLRTAVSEKSVFLLARSRRVAASNYVVYAELDRLLDAFGVSDADPIRVWRHERERGDGDQSSSEKRSSDLEEEGDDTDAATLAGAKSSGDTASNARRMTESSSPVILTHFDAPGVENHSLWLKDGLAGASASGLGSAPSWHLALRDIIFNEADKIGQGAFGAVYKGRWLDTPVVVKFMGYEEDLGMISTDLLLHEVRVWHRLNHPHVLKLYGANHSDKRYFVCELAGGGDLIDYLKKPGNELLTWQKLHEAALGLEYLHERNAAHNDLKCDNLMVGMDGKTKVIDFGLSALLGEAEIRIDVKRMGAVHWRSPEYLAGGRPSRASDVYSFAMCIIECVGGAVPWGPNMVPAMVKLKVKKGFTPTLPASMSEKQRNLVDLMAAFDPAQRVKMGYVVDKLSEFAQDERAMRESEKEPETA